jgi:hypothetical protein
VSEEDAEEDALLAKIAELERVPTATERAADPEHIAIIRRMYGSRAQTIINVLLAFDAFFSWYYPFKKSIPLSASEAEKEARAFDNCCTAIDMHEIYERVSIRRHKSFLPHGAIFKVSQNILKVADVHAFGTSSLELQNAETKRVARDSSASRRQELTTSGMTIVPMRGTREGPAQLIKTKGYCTTMALSLLNHLLAQRYLRAGDGVLAVPDSRRKERLLHGIGRLTLQSTGVQLEKARPTEGMWVDVSDICPADDSCIAAFIRLISVLAEANKNSEDTQ